MLKIYGLAIIATFLNQDTERKILNHPVLWCGASAWHRPAPRGEKSHRPAPTPQAGAKKLIAPPQRPKPGRKSHRPAPTPQAAQWADLA